MGQLFHDGIHVRHAAYGQLLGQAVIVQAGAAGHDLHTFRFQRLEVLQHGRALTGQGCTAVIEQNRLGQLVLLRQGKHERLEQGLAQLLGPGTHSVCANGHHGVRAGVRHADGRGLFSRRGLPNGKQHSVFPFGQLFGAVLITLLLGHLGQVLHGDLVVHQNFHLTSTLQLRNSALGLDDRQRAGVSSCINMSHNRFSFQ